MFTDRLEVHVSTVGSAYGDGSLGYPVSTLHEAMGIVRRRREPRQRAVVWVHPGVHRHPSPLRLTPDDSFTTFAAWDGTAETVIDGGEVIRDWAIDSLAGVPVWVAPAPQTAGRSLFIDGERMPRPRFPREGFLRIADQPGLDVHGDFVATLFDGADRFTFDADDIPQLTDETNVEVVVPHYWVQERLPITAIDRERSVVHSDRRSIFALRDDAVQRYARYYLDNVVDVLGERPGEWYLDTTGSISLDGDEASPTGPRVLYVPRPGETPTDLHAVIPTIAQFVVADGRPESGSSVNEIRFESLSFRHADWPTPPVSRPPYGVREDPVLPRDVDFAAGVQAASEVPAAIEFHGARVCAFLGGAVEHVGGYGIAMVDGCRGNLVADSRFTDLGAGAIKAGGDADREAPGFNRANAVLDNDITAGGRIYPHAVAVLFMHGAQNVIAHNHIADFSYTGISVGWVWDYADSVSTDNLIEGNHIHDLGRGLLNDMGGVYLLGIAPGTRVRGNRIHDIVSANYGGWGIYLDEGSSHVVVEENLVHDVSTQCFHLHYGRENILRQNIFAFGGRGQLSITRPEQSISLTVERNVFVGARTAGFAGTAGARSVRRYTVVSDLNLFWDYERRDEAVIAADGELDSDDGLWRVGDRLDDEWRHAGHDRHSLVADPGFTDVEGRDFTLLPGSAADGVGFVGTATWAAAGPRPLSGREHPLASPTLRVREDSAERA